MLIDTAHGWPASSVTGAYELFIKLSLVLPQEREMQVRAAQNPRKLDSGTTAGVAVTCEYLR